jgi:glycosyltransferase involved in cell wall biosynthesis/membrane-associated phospholipid phosphatase
MTLANVDLGLAERLNRFAAHHDGWEDAARACASASELVFVIGLAVLLTAGALTGRRRLTGAGLLALASAALGLGVTWLVSLATDRPRPFVAHPLQIHAFLGHAPDAGFPSDHATAAFAIATALTLRLGVRAAPVLVAAAAVAISRVLVGVHYPSDVLAGAAIGAAAAVAVCRLAPRAIEAARPRLSLVGHRSATAAATMLLRLRPREVPDGRPKVYILLAHAWGMGGTIRTTFNLASYLAECHDVEVISVAGNRNKPFFSFPDGVTVTLLDDRYEAGRSRVGRLLGRVRSLLIHPADRMAGGSSLWTDVLVLRKLWRVRSGVLLGTRPALNLLVLAAKRPGLAVVGEEHMHLGFHNARLAAAIRHRYRKLDALVTLTEGDRAEYAELLGGATRIERIPNAVPAIEGPRAPLTEPTIVAAGRLSSQKGFDRLIPAFSLIAADCPEWTLRIFGTGPAQPRLERQIARRGLEGRVLLLGRSRQLGDEMQRASMYVLSSRFEGFPMVILEAMTRGLPVVSFDCPTGPREVVRDGANGILVPDDDRVALAAAMLDLIHDPERRRRLGAAAAEDARRYSTAAIGPRWDELLASLRPQHSARQIEHELGAARGVAERPDVSAHGPSEAAR